MHYLSSMTDQQVLVMYSGHPLGLFPTKTDCSPRVVITNGLVSSIVSFTQCTHVSLPFRSFQIIPHRRITSGCLLSAAPCKFNSSDRWDQYNHTLRNLGMDRWQPARIVTLAHRALFMAHLYVSKKASWYCHEDFSWTRSQSWTPLGRNSVAAIYVAKCSFQPVWVACPVLSRKHVNCLGVSVWLRKSVKRRQRNGMDKAGAKNCSMTSINWLLVSVNVDETRSESLLVMSAMRSIFGEALTFVLDSNRSSAFRERLAEEKEDLVDLGSDQTSCHNPYQGGYYPVQVRSIALSSNALIGVLSLISYPMKNLDTAWRMNRINSNNWFMKGNFPNDRFMSACFPSSIRRQIAAIDKLHARGMYFFDYGNAFLLTAKRAGMFQATRAASSIRKSFSLGAPVGGTDDHHCIRFKYPSYVQDIMGDIFSLGFGPFRFVVSDRKSAMWQSSLLLAGSVHLVWPVTCMKQTRLLRVFLKSSWQTKLVGHHICIGWENHRCALVFSAGQRSGTVR